MLGAVLSAAPPQAAITIDYPAVGTIFPPEFPAPTFLWRDAADHAKTWLIEVSFGDRSPLQVKSAGERMRIGEIDPRCVGKTNELPKLTPEQAAAHTWTPDPEIWAAIRKRSAKRPATVTITGLGEQNEPVSRGHVTIQTSKDQVGAPIFYRDVPLMPSDTEKGIIKPLAQSAVPLIAWRLRNTAEPASRLLMQGLHSCANCHSFSRDGKTMGMDVDGPQNDKGLYGLVPVKPQTSIRNEYIIQWSTFRGKLGGRLRVGFMSQISPDGQSVVTTINDPGVENRLRLGDVQNNYYITNFKDYRFLQVFYATRGILAWYSKTTGKLQPLPGADDPKYVHCNAVWSPDGKYLVFARAEAKDAYPKGWKPAERANDPNETPIQYDLYRIPFNGGKGGKAEPIAGASRNGMSNTFPRVSPDGKWVVFTQCRNGLLMRPDGLLHIVPAKGGQARKMRCNTPLMNSWHSFSPSGRWMVFASKSRSPYTQMYLTHLDKKGNDSPAILIENATAANRAVNLPEFVNLPQDGLLKMDAPAAELYQIMDEAAELAGKGQPEAAAREWRRALELSPGDARIHNNLGVALADFGKGEEALNCYRKALELDPDYAEAHNNIGTALAEAGKLDEAIPHLQRALELNPKNAKSHTNLGGALAEKGRTDEAIAHYRKALEVDPDYGDAHNNLGVALARAGNLDEAIPHFEKALAANPNSVWLIYNLGRVLAAKGRFQEAIPHLEKAVGLSGAREPRILDMLANVCAEVGRYAQAVQAARRALDLATRQNDRELAEDLRARLAVYEAKAGGR